MPQYSEEFKDGLIKIAVYVFGTSIGLASKLAKVSQMRKLNKKDIIIHTTIAFSCAFLVWQLLAYYDKKDMANISSVIVGRFGDEIILLVYDKVKILLNSLNKDSNNKK